MGVRLINNNGQIITKLKSGQDDVKIKYEQINGKFEPVYYDGYVLYNSLKSDGNAYIDLGHKGDSTHRYELDFEWQIQTPDQTIIKGIFGTRTGFENKEITVLKPATMIMGNTVQYANGDGNKYTRGIDANNHRYGAQMSKTEYSIIIDGNKTTAASTLSTDFITDENLLAFTYNGTTIPSTRITDITFHSIKEYDQNNQLIYNYVPARRQSDNQLGMLDVINGVFYGNANSAGTFEV